jgi:hypothetical protein
MRKPTLVATLLVAAVIVLAALVLFLAKGLGSRSPSPTLPAEAATKPHAEPATPADPAGRAAVDPLAPGRASVEHVENGRDDPGTGSLRIRVAFEHGSDHAPRGLAVRVSNLLGVQRDARSESPLEFVAAGLLPGEYVVVAGEDSSITTAVHANVLAPGKESSVGIVLQPVRMVSVRVESADRRPLAESAEESLFSRFQVNLTIRASREPFKRDDPPDAFATLAGIDSWFTLEVVNGTRRFVPSSARDHIVVSKGSMPPSQGSVGVLSVPSTARFFVSAWLSGELFETQPVEKGQSEVVFTVPEKALEPAPLPVTYCLVDDETDEPIRAPIITSDSGAPMRTATVDPDHPGCGVMQIAPGWSTLQFQPSDPDGRADERFCPCRVRVHVSANQHLDLGQVRCSRARSVRFRVLDDHGSPVEGAEFELVRLSAYDGSEKPEVVRVWSNKKGELEFVQLARERYVVRCSTPRLDAAPRVVDGERLAPGDDRIFGDIVVTPVRQISLVFDEPPLVGTLIVVESRDGLPIRSVDVDEFGIVPLWLAGTDYRVHLVEDGVVTPDVPFSVDKDPFVLRIHR